MDAIIRKFPGVSEYQVLVAQIREMNEISIRAECGEADAHKLAVHSRCLFPPNPSGIGWKKVHFLGMK